MTAVSPGRWVWNDESQTMEFVSSSSAEKPVLRKRKENSISFSDLQQKAEWLAETHTVNNRGRQSIRQRLGPAQLNTYRTMVMTSQGDHVTIDDVKQVAVSLLQENYSLPIPSCFLTILKSKVLDEVLCAFLLYLSCFFDHKALESKQNPLPSLDITKENQMVARCLAKKDLAQKKLAVCYFTLVMDLEVGQSQHTTNHKGRMVPDNTEWLLHACLYSFFCYVAWVAFGRKDLKEIQEEVGRLLYTDTFNTAMRDRSDRTPTVLQGSATTTGVDPKETGFNSTPKRRSSQRHSTVNSIVNQRSPLMVCLWPSPKEQSSHLFLSSRVKAVNLRQPKPYDPTALMEEINKQLASVSVGIVGKPLKQFNPSTLIPSGEQRNNGDKDCDEAPVYDSH